MWLLAPEGETELPAEAREVSDVTGAGDTVIAALALGLAAGASLADAARLANRAAGIVVGKFGPATVSAAELGGMHSFKRFMRFRVHAGSRFSERRTGSTQRPLGRDNLSFINLNDMRPS